MTFRIRRRLFLGVMRRPRLVAPLVVLSARKRAREALGRTLDLQTAALLGLADWLDGETANMTPAQARRHMRDGVGVVDASPRADVNTVDRDADGVPARVYVPREIDSPSPALVFFHGGGWVVGSIESHDLVCRALAGRAGLVVVSVDYRLAPEHPFPAAARDAIAATRWVLDNAGLLGIDPARVAVGGDNLLHYVTFSHHADDHSPLKHRRRTDDAFDHRARRPDDCVLRSYRHRWLVAQPNQSHADSRS